MARAKGDYLVSADSHVIEDPHLWEKRLPSRFRQIAPVFPELKVGRMHQGHSGGFDPTLRVTEMAEDGVSQEVLYPSFGMNLFGLSDADLQEACFSIYNDWLAEYCSAAPDRLFGVATISTFDIDHAVDELERCKTLGIVGAVIWEVPPDEISFATSHYDPLWAAAEALEMPISLHIFTGVSVPWPPRGTPRGEVPLPEAARAAISQQINATYALSDIIMSGVCERFPALKFVLVESEASWIPFYLRRLDKSYDKSREYEKLREEMQLTMAPSRYFARNFFATFLNDVSIGPVLTSWGTKNCMWSNDFPHPNSTWPNSREAIARTLGHLSPAERARLTNGNVTALYELPIPSSS